MLLLSLTFFLVGTLDLLHTLSYKGMPYFISESSVAKAAWFWVSARMIQALGILIILLSPVRKQNRDYRIFAFLVGTGTAVIIGYLIIHFEKVLPILVVEGKGPTVLKNGIEYAVCFILFVSLIIALYQFNIEKCEANLAVALSFVFFLLAELIFTVYQSVYDLDNLTGHIFKAVGFYLILKSFYFENREQGQRQPERVTRFTHLPGFIFRVVKKGDEFFFTDCYGELLEVLGHTADETIGKSFTEVFSSKNGSIQEYCRLAASMQESIRFELEYMEYTLLVSINPVYDTPLEEVIIGTVMDITGIHPELTKRTLNQEDRIFVKK